VLLRHRYSRWTLLAFVSAVSSNCALLSGRCLYEIRNIQASGSTATSATDSASAILTVSEQRDYEPDKNWSWAIHGPDLKGHVQGIVLQESASSSPVRYDFPLLPATSPLLSAGFARETEGADLDGMFDFLSKRSAVIRITTDLADKPVVIIPLSHVQQSDWTRPYCS
jgi:hypothetical protein